jgi:hypothetical protein
MRPETIEKLSRVGALAETITAKTEELEKLEAERRSIQKELREGPDAAEVAAIFGVKKRAPRKSKTTTTGDGSSQTPAKKRGKATQAETPAS